MRYVVVDLEATCWIQRSRPERTEIIEIGAVLLASSSGPTKAEFSSFVRPLVEPTLSAFCMGLTGIRQQEVDAADNFSDVLPRFLRWIGSEPYQLCSWGLYDLLQFRMDCQRHGQPFPSEFTNHINLKQQFARRNAVRPCGVMRAMAMSRLTPEGRRHRAIDDARNIARLAMRAILPEIQENVEHCRWSIEKAALESRQQKRNA